MRYNRRSGNVYTRNTNIVYFYSTLVNNKLKSGPSRIPSPTKHQRVEITKRKAEIKTNGN